MSTPTRRTPAPIAVGYPALQWANGRAHARPAGESARFQPLVGWHIEAGRDPEVDAHARELGVARIEIRHQRPGGSEVKTHWALGERVDIYPLIDGLVADSLAGAVQVADQTARDAGVVADWPKGQGSYLALLALVAIGGVVYPAPVRVGMNGVITSSLYAALLRHVSVCAAADDLAGTLVPCPWLALPLQAGEELNAGRGETTPIVVIADNHTTGAVDLAYLREVGLPKELRGHAQGLVEEAKRWAVGALEYRRTGGQGGGR